MNKRGVGVGQVFVFIIAAVTFALVMIFGYKAINGFLESGEDVAFIQFKNDLESSVKKIYTEYGAVRIEEFTTPLTYEQICFVDMEYTPNEEEVSSLCAVNQVACSAWQVGSGSDFSGVEENVFLTPSAPVKMKVYRLEFVGEENHFLCIPIKNGHFSLALEGRGDKTKISVPG